jgi:hypothetical protein
MIHLEEKQYILCIVTAGALTPSPVAQAIDQYSPDAKLFLLIHKMDLIAEEDREAVRDVTHGHAPALLYPPVCLRAARLSTAYAGACLSSTEPSPSPPPSPLQVFQERRKLITSQAESRFPMFSATFFMTSIWDETLYKAWSSIVYQLIPNVKSLEHHLHALGQICGADEVPACVRMYTYAYTHVCIRPYTRMTPWACGPTGQGAHHLVSCGCCVYVCMASMVSSNTRLCCSRRRPSW